MISAIQKEDDGTIKLTITVPANIVKKTWDELVIEAVKQANLPGFRRGKAPKKLVEKNLDENKFKEEVLRKLLPEYYTKALEEHKLRPIINPRVHIESNLDLGKDLQFIAATCEEPQIELNNYKDEIRKLTAKGKIIVPGKEQQKVSFDNIVKALLVTVKLVIPKVLISGEVDKFLSQTLDEVKRLGLTLDQYLASTGRTADSLRSEYEAKADNDLKLEFILRKIAEVEKITVEDKEIEEAITKAKNEEEKKALGENRYLLASILRQQKTLDFLKNF